MGYSEQFDLPDFPTDCKSQKGVDKLVTKALKSPEFIKRFTEDLCRSDFLRYNNKNTAKIEIQSSHYVKPSDLRFTFNFYKQKPGNLPQINIDPIDDDYNIRNPGDSISYLVIIIKQIISKNARTAIIVHNEDNEEFGWAIKHGAYYDLSFKATVCAKDNPDLSDWLQQDDA